MTDSTAVVVIESGLISRDLRAWRPSLVAAGRGAEGKERGGAIRASR